MYNALYMVDHNKPLEIQQKEIPSAPSKGLVLKVKAAGLCHSDVHIWQNVYHVIQGKTSTLEELEPNFSLPIVLGHEIAGEVTEVGTEGKTIAPTVYQMVRPEPRSDCISRAVTLESIDADATISPTSNRLGQQQGRRFSLADASSSFYTKKAVGEIKVGDRLVVFAWVGCNTCSACAVEHDNYCNKGLANTYGVCKDGGFQEYLAVLDSSRVVKLPDNIAMDTACLLGCSALTAYHSLLRLRPTVQKSVEMYGSASVVIVGAGGLGLWGLRLSRFVLPQNTKVFLADISEDKLELARKNGADGTILWEKSEPIAQIVAKTKEVVGEETDGGIDFVGHNTTTERLYEASRNGSTVVCVGLAGGVMHLSTTKSLLKNINLSFVHVGSMPQLRELVALVGKHEISPPPITHYNLEDVNELIPKLEEGKIDGRAVVTFN